MYNIWSFFLQTISVSLVVGLILLLKYLFADKLSPRWQYSVWILFCIRVLIPVNLIHYIIPQISHWVETAKALCEKNLLSNYTAVYEPIQLHHVIPMFTQAPESITDWLFVIYGIGIVVCLLRYLFSYIRLRLLLKAGLPVSNDLEQKMLMVCEKYGLKPCKIVAVEGFTSAFICGVFRPILVVPYAKDVDEKILLHELLHLKYHDTIQNIGWCIIRSFQWCNPLVHYAIHRIENDMESLCDQRVLELLEGEERREYGVILLDMANQKYARIPGTTSISNGGKNITQRITAIVRFKKYPQGMALVSVCIILVLFWPTIIGSANTFTENDYVQYEPELGQAMAIARMNRCGTVAGALDSYAKGLYLYNGIYIASASSLSEHEEIEAELKEYGCYQSGDLIGNIVELKEYYIYNLDQRSATEYSATLCLYASVQVDEYLEQILDELDVEEGVYNCTAYIFIPVSVTYEDAWVVEETGERYIISEQEYYDEHPYVLCPKEYYGKNEAGEILLQVETRYKVDNSIQNNDWFGGWTQFDTSPKPNARFSYYELQKYVVYTHFDEEPPKAYIELVIKEMDTKDYFKLEETFFSMSDHSEKGWLIFEGTTDWNGTVEDVAGGGYGGSDVEIIDMPSAYTVQMNIGGVEMEDFILKEVTD